MTLTGFILIAHSRANQCIKIIKTTMTSYRSGWRLHLLAWWVFQRLYFNWICLPWKRIESRRLQSPNCCWLLDICSIQALVSCSVRTEFSFKYGAQATAPLARQHTQRGKSEFNHTSHSGLVVCAWCLRIRSLEINPEISFPVLGLLLAYCVYPRWFALLCAPLCPLMVFNAGFPV